MIDVNSILLLLPFFKNESCLILYILSKNSFQEKVGWMMRPLDSADAPLGVTEGKNDAARCDTAARCYSDWSDERSEERSGGISLTVVHPVNINIVDLLMKGIPD